jgi:hypothetical protein
MWGVAAALSTVAASNSGRLHLLNQPGNFLPPFLFRFFAGFCLVANGVYIGAGSFAAIGDAGDMLRYGSSLWQLWLFGLVTVPAGMALWHGQGRHFGLGSDAQPVRPIAVCVALMLCVSLVVLFQAHSALTD